MAPSAPAEQAAPERAAAKLSFGTQPTGMILDGLAKASMLESPDEAELEAYAAKIMRRFANPYLPDTVERVGRSPLRKLSRNDRFVGPASQLAERGMPTEALLAAMGAAFRFDYAEDAEAVELQRLLAEEPAEMVVGTVTGLEPDHPLYPAVLELVKSVQG